MKILTKILQNVPSPKIFRAITVIFFIGVTPLLITNLVTDWATFIFYNAGLSLIPESVPAAQRLPVLATQLGLLALILAPGLSATFLILKRPKEAGYFLAPALIHFIGNLAVRFYANTATVMLQIIIVQIATISLLYMSFIILPLTIDYIEEFQEKLSQAHSRE